MLSSLRLRGAAPGSRIRSSGRVAAIQPGVDVAMLWVVAAPLVTSIVMVYSA